MGEGGVGVFPLSLLVHIFPPLSGDKGGAKTPGAPTPLRPALCLAGNASKASAFPSRQRCGAKQGLPLHPPWRATHPRLFSSTTGVTKGSKIVSVPSPYRTFQILHLFTNFSTNVRTINTNTSSS